jgi:DNA-directed RNA polymerase specialized sigma24 family protein
VRLRRELAIADGTEAEFEAYVALDGGRLLGFALLLVGDYQDAEDLVQVALLRSAGRWPTARQNPEGYTRAILVNLARDRWRARREGADHGRTAIPHRPEDVAGRGGRR